MAALTWDNCLIVLPLDHHEVVQVGDDLLVLGVLLLLHVVDVSQEMGS